MTPPPDPPFLERVAYLERRIADSARILPILGIVAFFLPLLWAAGQEASVARTGLYLFSAWAVLIACALFLSRRLARLKAPEAAPDEDAD